MKERSVACDWRCRECCQTGEVAVWPYPDETDQQTANRHTFQTRGSCRSGCLYLATPKVAAGSPPHASK